MKAYNLFKTPFYDFENIVYWWWP